MMLMHILRWIFANDAHRVKPKEIGMQDVINWRRLDAQVTTSGQPTEAQLAQIKALGVRDVINLGPHSNKGALVDEAGTVAELGMRYVYIPVDFDAPTDTDFAAFCSAMAQVGETSVHVHCIYNARVSAFFYRYAQEGRGGSVDEAFARMDGIWRPGGVWAEFIGKDADIDLPNRYAGDDY
ncbi:protein tyrosine phosphatase family protein [Litoreibacter sp.]|nr:protein tyrosine phosphatase family protein [Litoreibacter sp.]